MIERGVDNARTRAIHPTAEQAPAGSDIGESGYGFGHGAAVGPRGTKRLSSACWLRASHSGRLPNRRDGVYGRLREQVTTHNRVASTPTLAPVEGGKGGNDSLRFNLTPDSRTYAPLLFSPLLFFDPCLSFLESREGMTPPRLSCRSRKALGHGRPLSDACTGQGFTRSCLKGAPPVTTGRIQATKTAPFYGPIACAAASGPSTPSAFRHGPPAP